MKNNEMKFDTLFQGELEIGGTLKISKGYILIPVPQGIEKTYKQLINTIESKENIFSAEFYIKNLSMKLLDREDLMTFPTKLILKTNIKQGFVKPLKKKLVFDISKFSDDEKEDLLFYLRDNNYRVEIYTDDNFMRGQGISLER